MAVLAADLEQRLEGLRESFDSANPFRHVVVDGFLAEDFCRQLSADFPGFEDRYARNEMGQVGGKAVRQDLRDLSEAYGELDRLLQSGEFLQLMSRLTGIDDLLYDPDYVGGGTHENRHGQGLAPHVDFNYLPKTGWHRRLNLILYLEGDWQESWGGCLDLHSDPWDSTVDEVKRVLPAFNRCVLFETNEVSWHGFEAIDLPESERHRSRRSIAIYLYTRERDPAETAPSHGTIYVPPGLPPQVQPGQVLDEKSYLELRRRFAQLKGQLKFLYRRELEESGQRSALIGALQEARSAVAFPLQGYAVQAGPVSGYWPDGWVSPPLQVSFNLGRAARKLNLEIWTPGQLSADPELVVELPDGTQTIPLKRNQVQRLSWPIRLAAGQTLTVRMSSNLSFVPAADGQSGDDRELAFKLISAELD